MAERSNQVDSSGSDLLIGQAAIAQFLSVNPRSIARMIRDEKLPAVKIGLHLVASVRQVVEWVERRATGV
jgi:hypothetical protein